MSSPQPSLFGAYPWAVGASISPVLYASGYVPQTFSVTLSDSVTGTEADLVNITKALSESVTLSEAQIATIIKILADSSTVSDSTVVKTIEKVLTETVSVGDQKTIFFTIKQLSDFLVLKEWISIRLNKQITWVNPPADTTSWLAGSAAPAATWANPSTNANIFDTLWGKYTYGGRNVLWGGLKPLASWSKGTRGQSPWTNEDGHKYNS